MPQLTSKELWSFTEQKFWPVGTEVWVTKQGKREARDRAQVRNKDGHLAVTFIRDLKTPTIN